MFGKMEKMVLEAPACYGSFDPVYECLQSIADSVAQMAETSNGLEKQECEQHKSSSNSGSDDDDISAFNRKRRALIMGVGGFLSQVSSTSVTEESRSGQVESVEPKKARFSPSAEVLEEQNEKMEMKSVKKDSSQHPSTAGSLSSMGQECIESLESTGNEISEKGPQFTYNLDIIDEIHRESDAFKNSIVDYGFRFNSAQNNYLSNCCWSFVGCYLATTSQDRITRVFKLDENNTKLSEKAQIRNGALLYDISWHPRKDWLAVTGKEYPIHIIDSNGVPVATCRGHNHFDELVGAYSVCFSPDGEYLYAGYNSNIKKFDMGSPRDPIKEFKTWVKQTGGQKGIISCIRFNPVILNTYAAGSYEKSLALYSDFCPGPICTFTCPSAVTAMHYSSDGNLLYAAGRKDDKIYAWDLRTLGKYHSTYIRPASTNQKMHLDIDSSGQYLFSGSSSGDLCIFDLNVCGEGCLPVRTVNAHRASCGGVSVNKHLPIVATCSGQRVFPLPRFDDEEDEKVTNYQDISRVEDFDNSLALWRISAEL